MVKDVDPMAFHVDSLQYFNEKLYKDVFTKDMLISKKKAVKIKTTNGPEIWYGYFLERGDIVYFLPDVLFDKFPFKINPKNTFETDYKGDVFTLILPPVTTVKFSAEKRMSFRDLIDYGPNFDHSEPLHFTLAKIIQYTAMIDRINARIVTEAGFGKDSIAELLSHLVGGIPNLYGATFAKLEYLLTNKVIVLNEMGNLKSEERSIMQNFLLAAGAYFNIYTKRTRKTTYTQETYDISHLSLLVFHNLPEYYISKGQDYFETMFSKAVAHRFMPFVFDGRLTTDFHQTIDVQEIVDKYDQLYKDIISTIKYYQENKISGIKYNIPEDITFKENEKRHERTFKTILKYVSEYATDQEEFNNMAVELYNCYRTYKTLIQDDNASNE